MTYLLPHLLSASARAFPDHPAVESGDDSISYRELDLASDRLAAVLVENGVARGDRVAIFAAKSIGAVIAMHGIMKAGAAYVPIDPAAPPARAAYILGNCGVRVLCTSARKGDALVETLAQAPGVECVVLLDDLELAQPPNAKVIAWREVAATRAAAPAAAYAIETDLAYILYTSGSTGVPKGVMISHLNARTFIDWARVEVGVTHDDRLSSHAPLHFDLSIFDIFVAMQAGATVVLVPDGLSSFPFRLAEWIQQKRITAWYSVPTILSLLLRNGKLERFGFEHLRVIIFAGEVFPVKYLQGLMQAIPHPVYYNFYGPTETNVITYYRVPEIDEGRVVPIPIGVPCANMEVFAVADDGSRVTRAGEVGELYARGSCVAYGYWGDAEKTAHHFVENPLARGFREVAYRTGDLVTLDDDGNFLFLGRRDDMVKSRGYRIELGEVESALYKHAHVREAAVIAIPDTEIGNRLVAFVVTEDGKTVEPAELQDFCTRSIPRYMVPETIELRDELPKTSTGKIDKVSLARNVGAARPAA